MTDKSQSPDLTITGRSPIVLKTYYFVIFIGFALRICVAIWNGFYGPSLGAELDAASFFRIATEASKNYAPLEIGTVAYTNSLGFIFFLTTPSLFLGSLVSCVAWFISAYILIQIMKLVNATNNAKLFAITIFSFLPSSILFTSITLREPFQLLFMTLVTYTAVKILLKGNKYEFFLLVIYTVAVSLLHGVFLVSGVLIFGLTVLLYFRGSKRKLSFPGLAKLTIGLVTSSVFVFYSKR